MQSLARAADFRRASGSPRPDTSPSRSPANQAPAACTWPTDVLDQKTLHMYAYSSAIIFKVVLEAGLWSEALSLLPPCAPCKCEQDDVTIPSRGHFWSETENRALWHTPRDTPSGQHGHT